jgi:hypothetical protein
MVVLTIEISPRDPEFDLKPVKLFISASDAWKILEDYGNKYPNTTSKTEPSLEAFLKKWTDKEK